MSILCLQEAEVREFLQLQIGEDMAADARDAAAVIEGVATSLLAMQQERERKEVSLNQCDATRRRQL
jgi:hypothetical protein